jgi:hypothetical protein
LLRHPHHHLSPQAQSPLAAASDNARVAPQALLPKSQVKVGNLFATPMDPSKREPRWKSFQSLEDTQLAAEVKITSDGSIVPSSMLLNFGVLQVRLRAASAPVPLQPLPPRRPSPLVIALIIAPVTPAPQFHPTDPTGTAR